MILYLAVNVNNMLEIFRQRILITCKDIKGSCTFCLFVCLEFSSLSRVLQFIWRHNLNQWKESKFYILLCNHDHWAFMHFLAYHIFDDTEHLFIWSSLSMACNYILVCLYVWCLINREYFGCMETYIWKIYITLRYNLDSQHS